MFLVSCLGCKDIYVKWEGWRVNLENGVDVVKKRIFVMGCRIFNGSFWKFYDSSVRCCIKIEYVVCYM